MQFDGNLQFVINLAKAGNAKAQKDLASIVHPENVVAWDGFHLLNKSRTIRYDGKLPIRQAIPLSEITSYCDLAMVHDPAQRVRVASSIQKLNEAFFDWTIERVRGQKTKST